MKGEKSRQASIFMDDIRRKRIELKKKTARRKKLKVQMAFLIVAIITIVMPSTFVVKMIGTSFIKDTYQVVEVDSDIIDLNRDKATMRRTLEDFDVKKKVVIDAGHGGHDNGANYKNILEKDITLSIALEIGDILENNNIDVIYTRDEDKALGDNEISDLDNRVYIANKNNADYLISLHINSADIKANGFEVWFDFDKSDSLNMAKNIENSLDDLNYTEKRPMKDGKKSLHIMRKTYVPTVLVELGFMNSYIDREYLKVKSNQDKIAKAIADAIIETLVS